MTTHDEPCTCGHRRGEHRDGKYQCNHQRYNPSDHESYPCGCRTFSLKSPSGNPQPPTYKAASAATTSRFRKKPVVVQAVRYEIGKGIEDAWGYRRRAGEPACMVFDGLSRPVVPDPKIHGALVPMIETLEGFMEISPGDWVITGIAGERYPCKPDIFEATYEAV